MNDHVPCGGHENPMQVGLYCATVSPMRTLAREAAERIEACAAQLRIFAVFPSVLTRLRSMSNARAAPTCDSASDDGFVLRGQEVVFVPFANAAVSSSGFLCATVGALKR